MMLKSYAFDVDANLVFTDDTIWINVRQDGKRVPTQVSQKEDAELAEKGVYKQKKTHRYLNDNIEEAMQNFRWTGKFEQAIFDALAKPQHQGEWPSWKKFIEANRYASPIAIITARGHPAEELKETHKKIITDILTSDEHEDFLYSIKERLWEYKTKDDDLIQTYLDSNFYAPCSNEDFLRTIGKTLSNPMPDRKNTAFEAFVVHAKKTFENYYWSNFMAHRKMRVGFSDDTFKNIEGLHHFIRTKSTGLMRKYPEVLFRMYETSEPRTAPTKFSYRNTHEENIN